MTKDVRFAMWCGLLPVLVALLSLPWANIGMLDDYSYAFTTRELARTGAFTYNGWATAMVGLHAVIGAVFVKIFGFSFYVLKSVGVAWAAGCGVLGYILGRKARLEPNLAMFGSLTCVLSMVGVILTPTFMTDLSGLFFMLLTLLIFIRAGEISITSSAAESAAEQATRWRVAGCLVGFLGGTTRQIIWFVPLILLTYQAFRFRDNKALRIHSLLMGCGLIAAVIAVNAWYTSQRFSLTDFQLYGWRDFALRAAGLAGAYAYASLLTCLLIALPVFAVTLPCWSIFRSKLRITTVVLSLGLGVVAALGTRGFPVSFWPYLGVCITPSEMNFGYLFTVRTDMMPELPRFILLVVVHFVAIAGVANIVYGLISRALNRGADQNPTAHTSDAASVDEKSGWLVVQQCCLTGAAYFLISYSRIFFGRDRILFDRYWLPLILLFGVPLLWAYSRSGGRRIGLVAIALLSMQVVYGVTALHNHFAAYRAVLQATEVLRRSGVPRREIVAGVEYDSWTQMLEAGTVWNDRLKSEDKLRLLPPATDSLVGIYPTRRRLPNLLPHYMVVAMPVGGTVPAPFPPIEYHAWLPPFDRELTIVQIPWQSVRNAH